MISSRRDFYDYLAADRISLGITKGFRSHYLNEIYRFQFRMRKLELALNCSTNPIRVLFWRYLFRKSSVKLGFSISPNTFGPGLSIAHRGTIVVNGGARIGANCRIHADVNIGTEAGESNAAPTIGDNCYIGPGAKIFGSIKIASNSVIGANAVVNKSFTNQGQTIAGVPAKVISNKSSKGYLIEGYKAEQEEIRDF
jgi:serine O-acetyltransferase